MNDPDYIFNTEDIKNEVINKSNDYTPNDKKKFESIVKYALLCLLNPDDIDRYQLLYNENTSYSYKLYSEDKQYFQKYGLKTINYNNEKRLNKPELNEEILKSNATEYYKFFEDNVNELLIFYIYIDNNSVRNPIIPNIRSLICDIYDGIVLLKKMRMMLN